MNGFAEKRTLATVSLLVDDYDEAIRWYVDRAGFRLIEDTDLGDGKRWVVVTPSAGREGASVLLARARGERQRSSIGAQAGGRVFLFLETDDFARDHAAMQARGVEFREAPRHEPYGIVAVFCDLYGNPWDLIEPKHSP